MSQRRRSAPAQALGDKHIRDNVQIELAAYLQYSVREHFPPGDFLDAASKHLVATLGKKVTPNEVEGKLRLFWSYWGPVNANPSGFRKLYTLELKCLPRVPKDFEDEARKRADDLERSASRPRALRSASRTPNSIRSAPPRTPKRRNKSRLRSARKLCTNSPSPLRRAVAASTLTAAKRRQQHSAGISIASPHVPEETIAVANPTTPTVFKCERPSFEINDSQERASERDPASYLIHGGPQHSSPGSPCTYDSPSPPESPTPARGDHVGAEVMYQSLKSQHEISLAQIDTLEVNLDDLRHRKNEEIEYLRTRCHQSEAKYDQLQAEYDALHAKAAPRLSGVVAINHEHSSLQERNSELRREIARLHNILAFSSTSHETFPRVEKAMVIGNFNLMHTSSRDVLQDHAGAFNFDMESFRDDAGLCGLFRKVFNVDLTQVVDRGQVEALFVGISTRSMLRALLGAAVCEWVFEADLRGLFQECDRLYSRLRELLARQNVDVTQCLEFSALQAELDDPMTEACIIPIRARMLARQLLQKLLPVIKSQGGCSGTTSSDYSIERAWLREEERITEVFKLALQTATRLLVSTDLYRCVWPFPGTRLGSSMKRDVETFSTDAMQPAAAVALAILPGLQRCAASERNLTFRRFLTAAEVHEGMVWESWYKPIVTSK